MLCLRDSQLRPGRVVGHQAVAIDALLYWGGEAVSCQATREANDNVADAQRQHPDRIRWFASLPREYPQRAVEELQRSCAKGAVGVMVLANMAGKSLTGSSSRSPSFGSGCAACAGQRARIACCSESPAHSTKRDGSVLQDQMR